MRRCLILVFCIFCVLAAQAATGRVIKVLPHFLDQQGRHTVSPSLFDRDAYQAVLRQHPEQRSGMRFDIEWRVKGTPDSDLKLRLEARGSARGSVARTVVFETHVEPKGWVGQWKGLTPTGEG